MQTETWIGIIAAVLIAGLQVYIVRRIDQIDANVRLSKWDQARNTFFAECFVLSGDLVQGLAVYTDDSDDRVYVCENLDFPLHDIVNRAEHLYNQARINAAGLTDEEVAELSGLMSKLRFAANSAQDALRAWQAVENSLPFKEAVTDREEFCCPVTSMVDRDGSRTSSIMSIHRKHAVFLAFSLRECLVKVSDASNGLYEFSMRASGDGKGIEELFPPGWYGGSEAEWEGFSDFKRRREVNIKTLERRIVDIDKHGIYLIKVSEEHAPRGFPDDMHADLVEKHLARNTE